MFEKLKKWREERGLDIMPDKTKHFAFIAEEMSEGLRASHIDDVVDAYGDIIVFCVNAIEQSGFDAEIVMDEIIKEIDSRKGAINPETQKFEKFKDDYHQSLWYKADFSKAKK